MPKGSGFRLGSSNRSKDSSKNSEYSYRNTVDVLLDFKLWLTNKGQYDPKRLKGPSANEDKVPESQPVPDYYYSVPIQYDKPRVWFGYWYQTQ